MSGSLSVVSFEGELNAIIQEYLDFGGFDRTLSTYQKECDQKNKPVASHSIKSKSNQKLLAIQNDLMQQFHKGKRDRCFKLWNENLPPGVRDSDAVAKKLEFYLNIYFAIYPIKFARGQREADRCMTDFKKYLENRGASLSQTTEFLPFYALPYVPNAKSHPSYKELFTDAWVKDLENRLEKFLTLTLKSTPQPKLFDLYRGNKDSEDSENFQQISHLQHQLVESERKAVSYIKRYNHQQTDYHNLIGITADLVEALELTVTGKPVTPEFLQEICARLFADHMKKTVDFSRPGTASQFLRQSIAPRQNATDEPEPYPAIDIARIKQDMAEATNKRKALLLQAVRWRLTQSNPQQRDVTMTAYRDHDLLGCVQGGPHRTVVLGLLTSTDELVKQGAARLFNAFASLCAGRTYLAQNQDLFTSLLDSLHSEEKESVTREMVLGALQKLSLRRNLQTSMIDAGLIEWLVKVLEDNDSLSDYTLEYSVALLMNLCLRTSGKKRCVTHANQTLKVLSDLLGHDNQEIRPYVNGALYSILAIPSIREEAKAMGMEEILRCFIKDDQPDMNRQIEFIIKQLNSTETVDDYTSDDEDEEEEEEDQDAMELDLDKDEPIRPEGNELGGEQLLTAEYLAPGGMAVKPKKRHTDTVMAQQVPLQRPVTPSQRRAADSQHPSQAGSRAASSMSQRPAGLDRPPTRSGSRPNTQESLAQSGLRVPSRGLSRDGGEGDRPTSQASQKSLRPQSKASQLGGKEYNQAFGSRPKIPRTPDVSNGVPKVPRTPDKRPTSRGSISSSAPPPPQFSESGPRPSSAGKSGSRRGSVKSSASPRPDPSTTS